MAFVRCKLPNVEPVCEHSLVRALNWIQHEIVVGGVQTWQPAYFCLHGERLPASVVSAAKSLALSGHRKHRDGSG